MEFLLDSWLPSRSTKSQAQGEEAQLTPARLCGLQLLETITSPSVSAINRCKYLVQLVSLYWYLIVTCLSWLAAENTYLELVLINSCMVKSKYIYIYIYIYLLLTIQEFIKTSSRYVFSAASQDKHVTIRYQYKETSWTKYLHLLIADTLGLVIVSSSCRPQSRAGVSWASSPCAWLFVLRLGSQESKRNSMEKFCSAKLLMIKRVRPENSTNYRRSLQQALACLSLSAYVSL